MKMYEERTPRREKGRIGPAILMWLLGVPIPVIIIIYLVMGGCS